ncbi:anti-sigma-I factor RsgI family protein [Oscillibacter sp.]|uniref:anti-sigma-I factor RsgI family protein n=1 Tax=Oscillibacter sp. TaxID=1945593 RepID=UPI002D808AFA|nr:hypothetical protein [Oscillibacter sp.]MBS6355460.1 hypothetical protein [Oscillibacter sp.]
MKYLVMETHPAYAVVLDEDGRFLKAANLRYQVGDTVQDIVELRTPQKKVVPAWKPLSGLAAAAACLCLVFFGWYQPNYTAYGTLRIQINPDVEMTVSRTDRVLDLEGLNADGEDLIEEYDYQGKDRETAANELVERAIDMGYLSDGETVSITVSSTDAVWQAREETQVRAQLEARYGETIVIRLGSDPAPEVTPPQADPPEIVIPVTPPAAAEDATDYGDTDYGPNADGATDYADTDHGPYTDGGTDYEGRDDGSDDGDDDDDDSTDDDQDDWDDRDDGDDDDDD